MRRLIGIRALVAATSATIGVVAAAPPGYADPSATPTASVVRAAAIPEPCPAGGADCVDGTSRKPDHDRVNQILAELVDPLLAELIARYDPDGFDVGIPPDLVLGLLVGWREQAWRNVVRLTNARNPFARAIVEFDIESSAVATAAGLATLTSYLPPLTDPGSRATHCAAHHADPPPVAYPFGLPSAY